MMGAPYPSTSVLSNSAATQPTSRRVIVASNDVGDAQWLQLRVGQALRIEHCEISVENILSQLEPSEFLPSRFSFMVV